MSLAPGQKLTSQERLIQAALELFSKRGMAATTREIADKAGVNEVTLFRLFETKGDLLAAVVREVVKAESEALDRVDLVDFNIGRDLATIARTFEATQERYQAFLRTMLSQRLHPELTEQIMREIIQPLRAKFIEYLAEGKRRGKVRAVELAPVVDAFTGMLLAGVLRRSVFAPGYSRETYLDACVALFLDGICPR